MEGRRRLQIVKVDLDGLVFCLNVPRGSSDSIVYLSVSYSVMASVFGLSDGSAVPWTG